MLAYLDPWQYRYDVGYQITESLISIGSGGIHGLGLGDGKQKLFFLPEAHTDYIMAIVGEELGLFGICAVAALFVILVWRGARAALRARDAFGCYLGFGITAMFGLQALVNLGVVLGALPTKGLPLPFVCFGGSTLVVDLFAMGILLNISRAAPEPAGPARVKGPWLPRIRWRAKKGDRKLPGGGRRIERYMTIIIAGGGTGGHLFPGIAVAEELVARGHSVRFVGTEKGIEARAVPKAGYPLDLIDVAGIKAKGFKGTLSGFFRVPRAHEPVARDLEARDARRRRRRRWLRVGADGARRRARRTADGDLGAEFGSGLHEPDARPIREDRIRRIQDRREIVFGEEVSARRQSGAQARARSARRRRARAATRGATASSWSADRRARTRSTSSSSPP